MQMRKLGRSGLEVSVTGIGCNNFGGRLDKEGTRAVIFRAIDLGVTLFDSYHCSRYNTNTGVLTPQMFHAVFARVRGLLDGISANPAP